MKSAEATSAAVVPLPSRVQKRTLAELEFLPAALEIVETPASPVGRAVGGAIIAFFLLALLWSIVGKMDIIATASGKVVPSGRTKTIQPFETGVIHAIHVHEGDDVTAGDVLIEIDPTANAADEKRLGRDLLQDRLDIARLSALLANDRESFKPPASASDGLVATTRLQMDEQWAVQQAKLSSLERQIAQKQAEADAAQATIAKGVATLPMLKGQFEIREALMEKGFGTKLMYLQAQQQVVEDERQSVVDTHRRDEAQSALAALQHQEIETKAEYRQGLLSDLSKAQTSAGEHEQDGLKASQRRSLQTITAPVSGTVQQLAVHTIGGVVTPGEALMMLVPKDSHLEIEADLANRDIGFVHEGQEAEIKIEAFTFTRYGLLHGTVIGVSQDAVVQEPRADRGRGEPRDGSDAERQAQQPSYIARIAVQESGIDTENGWRPLGPGMAVTTEIKTGRRRLIEFLLSPLLRMSHDFGGER